MKSGEIPINTFPTNISIDSKMELKRREMIESLALLVVRQHRRQDRKSNNSNSNVSPSVFGAKSPDLENES